MRAPIGVSKFRGRLGEVQIPVDLERLCPRLHVYFGVCQAHTASLRRRAPLGGLREARLEPKRLQRVFRTAQRTQVARKCTCSAFSILPLFSARISATSSYSASTQCSWSSSTTALWTTWPWRSMTSTSCLGMGFFLLGPTQGYLIRFVSPRGIEKTASSHKLAAHCRPGRGFALGVFMNRSLAALLALVAGVVFGALVRASGSATLIDIAHAIQPLGTLWLNALKMTLVPLIFAMVAKGMIALDRTGGGGRLLGITLPLLIGLLVFGMVLSFVFGVLFVAVWPVAPDALAPWMASSTGAAAAAPPTIVGMIVDLVPSNPVAAAAQGNLAAIVVFAIIFGFAVSRAAGGASVAGFIDGLADAMIRIVQWVLIFTPLGIFVLSLGLALDTGFAVAGFLTQIVIASCLTSILAIVVSYALAWLMGGVGPI